MKITADTMLFVVGKGVVEQNGVSHLTLDGLVNAVKGGLETSKVTVFTEIEEADEYSKRMKLLSKGAYLLDGLDTEKLGRLVAKIESDEIEELLEKIGV